MIWHVYLKPRLLPDTTIYKELRVNGLWVVRGQNAKFKRIPKTDFKHLDLRDLRSKPLPRANAPPDNIEPHLDYLDSQLPAPARHRSRSGEAGGSYDYLYVDKHYPEGTSA